MAEVDADYGERADDLTGAVARELAIGRLSVGHEQAVLAHVEALVKGYGEKRAADFIGAVAENLGLIVLDDDTMLWGLHRRAQFEPRLKGLSDWAREHYRPDRKTERRK